MGTSCLRFQDVVTAYPLGDPLRRYTGGINSVPFSPDGTRTVSGSSDNTVRLWDAATREPLGAPLQGHSGAVNSVSFNADGTLIVSGLSDNTVRMWDAATPLREHTNIVNSVSFSPDGIHIVPGSSDNTVRRWDAAVRLSHSHSRRMKFKSSQGRTIRPSECGMQWSVSPSRGILVGLGQFRSRHLARWDPHCIWFGGQHCQVLACSKLAAIVGVHQARMFNCLPGSKFNHASDGGPHCRVNQRSGPSLHLLLIQLNVCIAQQR
jgi:WD40 repeat protein